jgi:hypothetical protein
MRMRRIFVCDLSGSVMFFPHFSIKGTIFGETVLSSNVCFGFLYIFCLHISLSKGPGAA